MLHSSQFTPSRLSLLGTGITPHLLNRIQLPVRHHNRGQEPEHILDVHSARFSGVLGEEILVSDWLITSHVTEITGSDWLVT